MIGILYGVYLIQVNIMCGLVRCLRARFQPKIDVEGALQYSHGRDALRMSHVPQKVSPKAGSKRPRQGQPLPDGRHSTVGAGAGQFRWKVGRLLRARRRVQRRVQGRKRAHNRGDQKADQQSDDGQGQRKEAGKGARKRRARNRLQHRPRPAHAKRHADASDRPLPPLQRIHRLSEKGGNASEQLRGARVPAFLRRIPVPAAAASRRHLGHLPPQRNQYFIIRNGEESDY